MWNVLRPEVTVVIATRNRALELHHTLFSLGQQVPKNLPYEVIVVDNGSNDNTQSVLRRARRQLQMVALYEPVEGKSRALNRALDRSRGKLVAFTDDDVSFAPHWLSDLCAASRKYDSSLVFCGPIRPIFPLVVPNWLATHPLAGGMFGRFEPQQAEGPLPVPLHPFGANFAVRRSAIGDLRFRLDLGPSGENGALLGEDSNFVERLRSDSQPIIFSPSALVYHHLRADQLQMAWLFERAFNLGREIIALRKRPVYLGRKIALKREEGFNQPTIFELACLLNYHCGQMFQLHVLGDTSFDVELSTSLRRLGADEHQEYFGDSARKVYLSLQ